MDVKFPPQMALTESMSIIPISKTVTSTAAGLLTANKACVGVWLQSSGLNDSNAAVTGTMFVVKELVTGDGSAVLCEELVTGQSTWIPCSNTSDLKVKTQSGTAWVRGYAVVVQTQ